MRLRSADFTQATGSRFTGSVGGPATPPHLHVAARRTAAPGETLRMYMYWRARVGVGIARPYSPPVGGSTRRRTAAAATFGIVGPAA